MVTWVQHAKQKKMIKKNCPLMFLRTILVLSVGAERPYDLAVVSIAPGSFNADSFCIVEKVVDAVD